MRYPSHLVKLIAVLRKLPGVGGKTAERYAFQMLNWSPSQMREMALLIEGIPQNLHKCDECGCLKEGNECPFCNDDQRNKELMCVIASPREAYTIDSTGIYRGLYHVLGGVLSPLEGKGPETLAFESLKNRIKILSVKELVIALDSTIEGDATSHFLKKELEKINVRVSRLALGLPMGSSLEYIDGNTLSHALSDRRTF